MCSISPKFEAICQRRWCFSWNHLNLQTKCFRQLGFDSPEKLATRALPRERFSRVLGMFSSLEVKVLYPT